MIIANAANQKVLADTGDEESNRGLQVLDADLRPVKLPLAPGWNQDPRLESLRLIPSRAWPPPNDYDYSKVMVALLDDHGDEIVSLPLAVRTPTSSTH